MRENRELTWVIATLAVLLGLYAEAYYATLDAPGMKPMWDAIVEDYRGHSAPVEFRDAPFRVKFFVPIHWVDRHIRRLVWRPPR